jgi:hypothetical protein
MAETKRLSLLVPLSVQNAEALAYSSARKPRAAAIESAWLRTAWTLASKTRPSSSQNSTVRVTVPVTVLLATIGPPFPRNRRSEPTGPTLEKLSKAFDPIAFAAKLAFTDEVAELGISEEDATRLQIGFTRGKVYLPIRNDDGSISGFIGFADGRLKMPPQWIQTNVVKLKRA